MPSVTAATNSPSTRIPRRTGVATARDGVPLYYEVAGSGPAMVFVHGLGGNHAVWFQQVAAFAADHTVVTMSQRGFAPSGGDQEHFDVDLLVGDLEAVMDAAGVRNAAIVGQSMGGWTALGLALHSPERVTALLLADTSGGIADPATLAHLRNVGATATRVGTDAPPLGMHPALAPQFSRRRPDLAILYQGLASFGSPNPGAIVPQLLAARVSGELLRSMRVPTLFVVGSDDPLFPPDLVKEAARNIADSEVVVIDDAGHSPYFEKPREWNAMVRSFLDRR